MNFLVRWIIEIYLYIIYVRPCEIQRHCENEEVDLAARTVARYRRRNFSTVGSACWRESPECNLDDPSSCQRPGRAPDAGARRERWSRSRDGCTYVYASVRLVGPIRSRSTVTSFAVPSPITRSFHVSPPLRRARALKSEAFSTPCPPPTTCSMSAATLLVVRAWTPRGVHSRCTMTPAPHTRYASRTDAVT